MADDVPEQCSICNEDFEYREEKNQAGELRLFITSPYHTDGVNKWHVECGGGD